MYKKKLPILCGCAIFAAFQMFNILNAEKNTVQSENVEIEAPKLQKQKVNKFYATYAEEIKWGYGSTLLGFLNRNNIPEKTYYNLSPEDREVIADIKTDSQIYILRDSNGALLESFLPLNSESQVRVYYDFESGENGEYKIAIIPIISLQAKQKVVAKVQAGGGLSSALYSATQDSKLNQEFINAYKSKLLVQKDDRIAMIYYRKYRLGKPIGSPEVHSIAIESAKKFHYLFSYKNRYYDNQGKEMANFFLITPVKYRRISSKFSSGRKHPILGYTRPHFGVDYSATAGTPIYAAGEGRVMFSGVKGGYGKVVEIMHAGGIKTLYAHMSKISKNAKLGNFVRQGTQIGNVGSTGLSTGPHLHFGVYKNNKPINPLGQIKTARSELSGNDKKVFLEFSNVAKQEIDDFIKKVSLDGIPHVIIREFLQKEEESEDIDEAAIEDSKNSNS